MKCATAARVGHSLSGPGVWAAALGFRCAVRRSAPVFVVLRAEHDERFYAEATAAGLLKQGRTL